MTVARKPGHRGERAISRKPLRGECRAFSGVTWLTRVRFYPITLHTRLSGASGARHSPRPLSTEGGNLQANLARNVRRDRETVAAFCGAAKPAPQFNTRLLSGLSSEKVGTSISNFSPLSLTI